LGYIGLTQDNLISYAQLTAATNNRITSILGRIKPILEHHRERGKYMSDTIDLLEAIGKNATLRHASAEELAQALGQAEASDALKAAVMSGDSSLLSAELGHKPMKVDHNPHTGGHEEEEEPDHDHGEDSPRQPPKPDQNQPSRDR
jgi:hypothetical protein